MENLIKGNSYTDLFFTLFGLIGATVYFVNGSYIQGSVMAIVGLIYLAKTLKPIFRKK